MFRSGDIWGHISCKDVNFEIVKVTYVSSTYVKVKIRYISKFYNIVYNATPETVKIYRDKFPNWYLINNN